jgi:hypothetical protein
MLHGSKVVPVNAMKAYRGSRGKAPLIFNTALDGGEWSNSRPVPALPWGKIPVRPRVRLNILGEKNPMQLPRIEPRTIRPVA